jgi:cyanophycinase-like exopeptidase
MIGFGFVDSTILMDTHFDRRSRLARLIPGIKDCNKKYGIGVD